jgi:AbrB family looped-hinge helix DNA binding protein
MIDRKLVRIQENGQVTIPTEICKKLGLKRGDLVAVVETPEGVFITPQQKETKRNLTKNAPLALPAFTIIADLFALSVTRSTKEEAFGRAIDEGIALEVVAVDDPGRHTHVPLYQALRKRPIPPQDNQHS